ncbi:MAG: Rpn family recombination-promoting nuclease/putative transposase [Cyanobacteria bacterium J06650_10]
MAFPLQERYVNLLTDFGFKRVFGSEPNKQLLVDFLNTLLPAHHKIQSLSYKTDEKIGRLPADRRAIFYTYCQKENGERFIVEIHKTDRCFFKDRSLFYASFSIQEQVFQGEWNFPIVPIYSICLLDSTFSDLDKCGETAVRTVGLKDQNGNSFYENLTFVYVELSKFKKTFDQIASRQDKWLYLLKHLSELEAQPQIFQDFVFQQLFETTEIDNFSLDDQTSYRRSLNYYKDFEEGLERGRREEKLAIARSLLNQLPIEAIAQTTGLEIAEIKKLQ